MDVEEVIFYLNFGQLYIMYIVIFWNKIVNFQVSGSWIIYIMKCVFYVSLLQVIFRCLSVALCIMIPINSGCTDCVNFTEQSESTSELETLFFLYWILYNGKTEHAINGWIVL